jgi:hypothetical protein
MSTYYRRDEVVTDSMGNPLSGIEVYLCGQPASTNVTPPVPLIQLYADSAGQKPITQPVVTDGYGRASYYAAQGIYTCVYWSTQIAGLQVVLPDQAIVPPNPGADFNSDSSANGTITGTIDGRNTVFTLSAAPVVPGSLIFMVNGLAQVGFTLAGAVVTLAVAPRAGDVLTAVYVSA